MAGKQRSRFASSRSFRLGVLACVLTAFLAAAGVLQVAAWLVAADGASNEFVLGSVEPTVVESGSGDQPFADGDTVKQNVHVSNDSPNAVTAYVRASVSIYWQDADGNQLWEEPEEGVDYTLADFPGDPNWREGSDGFYYWTAPLEPNGKTENLIGRLECTKDAADGRRLVCEVAVQSIQASPAGAVEKAWASGVQSVNADGTLTIGNATAEGGA